MMKFVGRNIQYFDLKRSSKFQIHIQIHIPLNRMKLRVCMQLNMVVITMLKSVGRHIQ